MCQNISMMQLSGGTQALITKIKTLQLKERMSDREMAERLGCTRQLYQMTRTGKIPPGNKIIKGISAAFPELQQDVIYFLSNDADKSSINATKNPLRQPSEFQGWWLKRFCVGLLARLRK